MNAIRFYRLKNKLTIKELAGQIGYTPSVVYDFETGRRNPEYAIRSIAEVFGVPEKILLKRVKKIKVQSRLKDLRQRAKKTLEEVQLGINHNFNLTKQYLSLLERGKCQPSPKVQNALADYFSSILKKNITPQKLFPVIYG